MIVDYLYRNLRHDREFWSYSDMGRMTESDVRAWRYDNHVEARRSTNPEREICARIVARLDAELERRMTL